MVLAVLWGILSAQLCQKIATFVLADLQAHKEGHLELEALEGLANLGTSGQHANNCWRDLIKKLPQPGLPKPFKFEVPLKNKVLGFFKRQTSMMLPHEFLAALYHRRRRKLCRELVTSAHPQPAHLGDLYVGSSTPLPRKAFLLV